MVKCSRKFFNLPDFWISTHSKLSDFFAGSWQSGEGAIPLLIMRAVLALVALVLLIWALVEGGNLYWLLYLTNWGLLLLNLMMISGLSISIMAVAKKLPENPTELPWYVSTYWFFYNVGISLAFLITALYWILLYDPEFNTPALVGPRLFWLDVATHGLNSVLALTEVILSRTPVRIAHIYQPVGVGLWYAAFTALYYVLGGKDWNGFPYIYQLLDWRQGKRSSIVVFGSALGLIIIYGVVWTIAFLRDKISQTLYRSTSGAPAAATGPAYQLNPNDFV